MFEKKEYREYQIRREQPQLHVVQTVIYYSVVVLLLILIVLLAACSADDSTAVLISILQAE